MSERKLKKYRARKDKMSASGRKSRRVFLTHLPYSEAAFALFLFFLSFFNWGYVHKGDTVILSHGWTSILMVDVVPMFNAGVFVSALIAVVLLFLRRMEILDTPKWLIQLVGLYPAVHMLILIISLSLSNVGTATLAGFLTLAGSIAFLVQLLKRKTAHFFV